MKQMHQAALVPVSCSLCAEPGGVLLWRDAFCRVVSVDDPLVPGFLRVVPTEHVQEMTDLSTNDRARVMQAVMAAEHLIRRELRPDKVNLASLGNVVPHLHWHVIPRWRDDPWFPQPIWAPASRSAEVPTARREAADRMIANFGALFDAALAGH